MKTPLCFVGDVARQSQESILRSLTQVGLIDGPNPRSFSGGSAILFFDAVAPAVVRELQGLLRSGYEHVLAVAVGALPGAADTWGLLAAGASDVLAWEGGRAAATAAARLARWQAVDELLVSPLVQAHIIGVSGPWRSVLRQILEVARFTDASALLTGESGTGKELMAKLFHELDARPRKGDLVILDCTTVVPELSGSEFFGHERGAFTGAVSARDGAFALANDGTLFLDEVGDLPLQLQAQLLRVVQEHTYKRVGGNTWARTEFRLVCATNRDLLEAVRRGEFRHDLYQRVASWSFTLPPLRERPEDVLPLARHFIQESRPDEPCLELSHPVMEYLLAREYPGNIRDLRQLTMRMVHRHVGAGPITVGDIPEGERSGMTAHGSDWRGDGLERSIRLALAAGVGLKEIGRAAQECAIEIALDDEGGSVQRAARRLRVTDRALQLRRAARQGPASYGESAAAEPADSRP